MVALPLLTIGASETGHFSCRTNVKGRGRSGRSAFGERTVTSCRSAVTPEMRLRNVRLVGLGEIPIFGRMHVKGAAVFAASVVSKIAINP